MRTLSDDSPVQYSFLPFFIPLCSFVITLLTLPFSVFPVLSVAKVFQPFLVACQEMNCGPEARLAQMAW